MSLKGSTSHGPALLKPISLADIRKLASAVNLIFARDPGTAYVFQYPPEASAHYHRRVQATEPLRRSMLRRQLCNPNVHVLSAYVGPSVAGFAIWTPPDKQNRRIPLTLRVYDLLLQTWDLLTSIVYPGFLRGYFDSYTTEKNRRKEIIVAADAEAEDKLVPEEIRSSRQYWTLNALGVSRDHGRQGIGSQLLQWGMDRADESDTAIVIAASQEGEKLYARHGFKVLGRRTLLEDQVPGGVQQTYMIRMAKSQRMKDDDGGSAKTKI